ncbi:hypothetical protein D3C87_1423910 [compost metagenome]
MNIERRSHLLGDAHMFAQFRRRAMQVRHGGPTELELPAWLKRDAAGNLVVPEADRVFAVIKRVPAGFFLDAREERADALLALIGDRPQRIGVEHVLFVLGADAPLVGRLGAAFHRLDQVCPRRDEGRGSVGAGHEVLIGEGIEWSGKIARARRNAIAFYRQSPMIA